MKITSLFILPFVLLTSACISVQTYTSSEHQKYHNSDLKVPDSPYPIRLETEFFRNGKPIPAASAELSQAAKAALQNTKIAVVQPRAENTLKISGNNIADISQAVGQGFKTGLTLGLSGSTVQDNYQFTCSYLNKNQVLLSETYPHAIVSNIGNKAPPPGLTYRGPIPVAFNTVVSDIVTNCLGDIQKNGYLVEK